MWAVLTREYLRENRRCLNLPLKDGCNRHICSFAHVEKKHHDFQYYYVHALHRLISIKACAFRVRTIFRDFCHHLYRSFINIE